MSKFTHLYVFVSLHLSASQCFQCDVFLEWEHDRLKYDVRKCIWAVLVELCRRMSKLWFYSLSHPLTYIQHS